MVLDLDDLIVLYTKMSAKRLLTSVSKAPFLLVFLSCFHGTDAQQLYGAGDEFCERESFKASCAGKDEVILMRTAEYGRMKVGRCVTSPEYGHIGCRSNVLTQVDSKCSGRQKCDFLITDLHHTRPCPSQLMAYMEATYECVKVTQCPDESCSSGQPLRLPDSSSGYLASVVTSTGGCGSVACPWLLEPKQGQRFNVTFFSFQSPEVKQQQPDKFCQRLATIVDLSSHVSKDVTICIKETRVTRLVTSSDKMELRLFTGTSENPVYFIVYYEAIGCPDMEPPLNSWVKRTADTMTVTCNDNQRVWHLTCGGVTWVGDVGTCHSPDPTPSWSVQTALERASTTTHGILMVVGLGVLIGVIIGCSLLTIVIMVVKRRRMRHALQYERRLELLTHYSPDAATDAMGKLYDRNLKSSMCSDDRTYNPVGLSTGFGSYDTRSYTSPRPAGGATMCGSAGHSYKTSDGLVIHKDHMYESPNFAT